MPGWWASCSAPACWSLAGLRRAARAHLLGLLDAPRPASCPQQDQGRLIVQRPVARLGLAAADPGRCWPRSSGSPGETPGVAHTITIAGMSFVLSGQQLELRLDVRVLDPFEQAADARTCATRRSWPGCGRPGAQQMQGRPGRRLRRAADPRAERRRRLQADGRGPRRPRPDATCSARPTR